MNSKDYIMLNLKKGNIKSYELLSEKYKVMRKKQKYHL